MAKKGKWRQVSAIWTKYWETTLNIFPKEEIERILGHFNTTQAPFVCQKIVENLWYILFWDNCTVGPCCMP
jgi:hypothetical protein